MDDLLRSSVSEGSTTSTDYSVELTVDRDIKLKQDDASVTVNNNSVSSKETKRRPVGTLSRKQESERSETRVLEFEDSQAVRNAVYKQWLLEKKEKRIKETKSKSLLQDEEAKAIAKKEQLKADTVRAYNKWKMKKDEDLAKKLKVKQQEEERREEEATKAREKQQQEKQAIAAWQKKKDENLKSFLTSQGKKRKEEKQRLEEEAEKKAISKLAFDKWMEKKRRVLSETQKSHDCEKEQKNNIQSQALAFEEWKKRKDEQIKLQKSTKKAVEKVHKNPWRPARSVEYDYLKSPQHLPNEKSNKNNTSISSSSLSSSQSSTAPTLKSVKVCCQTLEYWCTCQK